MSASNPHILFADDDPMLRTLVATVLRKALPHVSVETVADGEEALCAYVRRPADLVITDYDMPQMNGLELLKTLRARHVGVPVVVISANHQIEALARAYGADEFLVKPTPIPRLLSLLSCLMSR